METGGLSRFEWLLSPTGSVGRLPVNDSQSADLVIVAARKAEQLEDNIRAVELRLSDEEVRLLDAASDPGVPYPKWMVLQLDTAEDPRSKALYPERYVDGGPWKDLRGTRWSN